MSIIKLLFGSKAKKNKEDGIPQTKKLWDDSSSAYHVSVGNRAVKLFAKNHRILLVEDDNKHISFAIRTAKINNNEMFIQNPIILSRGNALFYIQKIKLSPEIEVVFTSKNTKTGDFQPEKKESIVF